ncbi:hypothetical protein H311_02963 [Anncaliia algerae PRA109]|nr:hypothetical protein H311_02963 [Anncaliia algerae PRA109]
MIEKIKLYNEENLIVLGGYNKFVEIDEIMMNFKHKSHIGRSANNKTAAIYLIGYDNKITKCYAEVIKDKNIETILPIINRVVIPGSFIFTDEHKSYQNLNKQGFLHGTVCHKYEFLNKETGANTQAVESFNNYLKYWIKFKKGVETHRRSDFLVEFTWKFNHKNKIFKKLIYLLKI